MISQLTLKVQAKGVEKASKDVQTLATGVGTLQQALASLGSNSAGLKDISREFSSAARSAAKMGSGNTQIVALAQAIDMVKASAGGLGAIAKDLAQIGKATVKIGVAPGASQGVQSVTAQITGLTLALRNLQAASVGMRDTAKDLNAIAKAGAKMGGNATGLLTLTAALQSFSAAAQAAAQTSGAINLKHLNTTVPAVNNAAQSMNALASASSAANQQVAAKASNITTWAASASPAIGSVVSGFQGMQGAIQGATSFMSPLTGAVQAGIGAFQQLKAAVDTGTAALLQMGAEGAKVSQMDLAFNAIGGSAKRMQELRDLTGGIVDDVSLQKSFNMATLFDIPKDAVPKLLKAAQGASIAMGISAEKAVNDVFVAVARKSKPIADNIGVQMGNLKEVYQKFADSAGKDVKKLTEEEKQLAFTNVFLEKSTRQMSLAGAAQSNVFAQLTAKATNAENEFKVFISGMLANSGALDFVTSSITTMKQAFESAPQGVLQGAMKTLFMTGMELGKMLVPVFSAAVPVITLALDLFNVFAPVLTGVLGLAGSITQGLVLAVRIALIPFARALQLVVGTVQSLGESVGITTPTLDGMQDGIDQFLANNKAMIDAVGVDVAIKPEPVIIKTDAEVFVAGATEQLQAQLKAMERDAQVVLTVLAKPVIADDPTGVANALEVGGGEDVAKMQARLAADRAALAQAKMTPGLVGKDRIAQMEAAVNDYAGKVEEVIAARTAYLKADAAIAMQQSLGSGLNSGLVMAATQSSAAAAELFGAMGADLSGSSEMQLIAAAQALKTSVQQGQVAQGLRGVGASFGSVLKGGFGEAKAKLQEAVADLGKGLTGNSINAADILKLGSIADAEKAGGFRVLATGMRAVSGEIPGFNSGISGLGKAIDEAIGGDKEKKREEFFKGMADDIQKFGLIKVDSPVQQMTQNDIAALLDYQDKVVALSDSGEVLTGSQALLTNAIRANGNTASGAVDALKGYERTLIQTGDALVWMRQQAAEAGKDTSGFTALLERQAAQLLNATKARTEAEKKAKDEKKGGGKKNDGKQALRERAEMVGLGDFEKARLQAERTLAKDMKTAGADASLKEAARTIYADAVGKPALDELARIGNALGGATTRIGGMLASSAKALFDNPEVAEMVQAARTNLARAGLEMQTVDLGNGQSRRFTEREVAVNMELIALEKEWAAKRAILQEGSNAYLLVQSDYLLKKKALDDELKTQQEESAFAMLAGFEGVFSRVQGTFESLRDQGTVGEQAVAMLSGTVLSLGQDMAGMAEQFKTIDEAVKKGSLTSGQAEVQKANAVVGAAGRAAAGVIKNERARAAVQGAVEVALAASSYAIGDIASGIAHTAAAGLFFAAAGRGSGGAAAARNITPRRSAAGSDRNSSAGDRRQSQTQVNIFIDPLSGRGIVDTVNRDAGRQAGLAFNSRVMQGAARRTDL